MTQIERQMIEKLIEAEDVSTLTLAELQALVRQEQGIARSLPDGRFQIDPRSGDLVLFVTSRLDRPHDTPPPVMQDPVAASRCPICRGETTGIIDVAKLSTGTTFINKNLYPVLYPFNGQEESENRDPIEQSSGPKAHTVNGLHFLQWTSSDHAVDWHNLPLEDGVVVMSRLAALEKVLLQPGPERDDRFVVIIKNYGRLVGSSVAHGHQQIALSSVMPGRYANNARFEKQHGESFAAYMLRENPRDLVVRDYGPVVLLVPYFMRRPYDMMLIVKDVSKRFLHQMTGGELKAIAAGWRDAIQAYMTVIPRRSREVAFNFISNSGRGAGFFFEFLPYTQESGSFEHLGLTICEAEPGAAAGELRRIIDERRRTKDGM